jgi:peptidoglycan/xylan/chitin deacetylase (PgdA/CDA1 family)
MPSRSFLTALSPLVSLFASLALVGCALGVDDGGSESTAPAEEAFSSTQLRGMDLGDKQVTLTFDDGPGGRTLELGTYLQQEGIEATFFVLGSAAERYPSVLAKLSSQGHLIANHTYSHPAMTATSDPVGEVRQTDQIIAPYVQNGVYLFRAPYGDWNARVSDVLNASGLERYVGSVFWDVGGDMTSRYAADWACWSRGHSVQACADGYVREIQDRRRGIVLMHDVHGKTVDMVKVLVPRLKSAGYSFVRLDEVPNIADKVIAAGGTPGGGEAVVGEIACPNEYHLEDIGTEGGTYCTNGTDVWGPFTKAMTDKCLSWGGGSPCHTNRWDKSVALPARGTSMCPLGASHDALTTYCVEGIHAFGPFPQPLVDKCIAAGGGETVCRSARWNRNFLAQIQGRQ